MKATYAGAFREQALAKLFGCGERAVKDLAAGLNRSMFMLKRWIKTFLITR
ncbi:MAG: hypothetical protein WA970_17270 [Gammaproteobacteria bacterium]